MDILFAASEIAPIIKVGGLADVVSSLSKALRLLGHKVTIALPRYRALDSSGLMMARRLTPMPLEVDPSVSPDGPIQVTLFDGRLSTGVELVVLDVPGFHDRPGIYGEEGRDYEDNARRFSLFSRAVVELVRQRARSGSPFDLVHVHDWPTAMVAYLLRHHQPSIPGKTVLTLHNVAHQGLFPREALAPLGLSDEHFRPERLEFYGQLNFLKGGILAADALTTVSTTYANEILTAKQGERLDGVLRTRAAQLTGIVNGIDYAVWNPMTDPAIIARYDAEDVSNKGRCKSALLQEIGLEIRPDRPLLVSVGRVVAQKGSDLLASAMPKILKGDVSVVVAGEGDPALMEKLAAAAAKAPERAKVLGGVSEAVVHRLMAAADLVVVPSRFEPCGLVQLYAQRYGAAPVACRTGGLVDTIVDLDASLETGTGFLFDKPTATSLLGGVQRAVAALTSPRWPAVQRRIMRLDLGWDRPARRYVQVYRQTLAG
ncbi:glycogen synthase GlgA [Sorangium sp. So ce131]|uniref:glycogen synthase GlgA n=1 Tax=Sorangium sp. So ce131 TaxID=3133282 RepID=UPI003F6105E4